MRRICTFCGHGDILDDQISHFNGEAGNIKETLEKAIIYCIENHSITEFYSSGYGKFDNLGATIVFKLQKEYPHIKSVRVLNYVPTVKNNDNINKYHINFHETIVCDNAENVPPRARIPNCNKYMVNSSDIIIACVNKTFISGAYTTYKYAKKQKKNIINLLEFNE